MSKVFALVSLLFCFAAAGWPQAADDAHKSWRDYGGAEDSAQYSALSQITRANVNKLQVAWTYPTGDTEKYSFSPTVANGLMYVLAKNNSIVALDARTGKEVWVHADTSHSKLITHRGINYWQSQDGADRRLFFAVDNFLQAIDARTGKSITSFGHDGRVDLREGLGREAASLSLVQSTTPGRTFGNLLIIGSATNEEYRSGPGDIRAFDVRSGKLVWTFHTIPHPGEYGYQTWPKDAWKAVGGANSWSELSVDEKRGIVYVPTASPKYNFYGADRVGMDLFGDSLIALDARTGKRLWHFQMVHHDIWDYDNATSPKLLTVRHDGAMVDIVAQPNKEGFVWVFNRVTGAPLWPIAERPEPASDMPGEKTWPTQPFPVKPPPFARQAFTERDVNPYLDPEEQAHFKEVLQSAHNHGLFTPPGLTNTIEMPGNNGGGNWGGAAVDPRNGTLYVVSKDLPCLLKLEPRKALTSHRAGSPEQEGHLLYDANCQRCHLASRVGEPPAVPSLVHIGEHLTVEQIKSVVRHGQGPMPAFPKLSEADLSSLAGYLQKPALGAVASVPSTVAKNGATGQTEYVSGFGFMFAKSGLPAISPPWTTMTAYDLNKGTIEWQIPLGDVPELASKGAKNTGGVFQKIGPVVTAGGLIFVGTRDGKVRALDERTGQLLWEKQLDAAVAGVPAVYEMNGKEYLVVCAAEQSAIDPAAHQTVHGAYVAFALPDGLLKR
jgi:quinoprotein glucose dehydrogenase